MRSISCTLALFFGLSQVLGAPSPAVELLESKHHQYSSGKIRGTDENISARNALNTTNAGITLYDTTCNWDHPFGYWVASGIQNCAGELDAKHGTPCVANPVGNFCRHPSVPNADIYVTGLARDGIDHAQSSCHDISVAVVAIYNQCNKPDPNHNGQLTYYGGELKTTCKVTPWSSLILCRISSCPW
jgi:hypothetical protein